MKYLLHVCTLRSSNNNTTPPQSSALLTQNHREKVYRFKSFANINCLVGLIVLNLSLLYDFGSDSGDDSFILAQKNNDGLMGAKVIKYMGRL